MRRSTPGLTDDLHRFIGAYWDTDVREDGPSAAARVDTRNRGIEEELKRFLADVILRQAASPEAWSSLVNAQTDTPADVRRDATEFWMWLYDDAPTPGDGGATGTVQPPQV